MIVDIIKRIIDETINKEYPETEDTEKDKLKEKYYQNIFDCSNNETQNLSEK